MKKTVIRINQKDLQKMFEKSFSTKQQPEETIDEKTPANPKIKLFLTKDEISFLLDVIDNVDGDSPKEKSVINSIKHGLNDCLINS